MVWWYVLRMIAQEQAETRRAGSDRVAVYTPTGRTCTHRHTQATHLTWLGSLAAGPTALDLDLALSGPARVASMASLEG